MRHRTAAFLALLFLSIPWDAVLRPGGHLNPDLCSLFGAQRGTRDPSEVCNYRRFHGLGPQRPASVVGTLSGRVAASVFLDFGSAAGSPLHREAIQIILQKIRSHFEDLAIVALLT